MIKVIILVILSLYGIHASWILTSGPFDELLERDILSLNSMFDAIKAEGTSLLTIRSKVSSSIITIDSIPSLDQYHTPTLQITKRGPDISFLLAPKENSHLFVPISASHSTQWYSAEDGIYTIQAPIGCDSDTIDGIMVMKSPMNELPPVFYTPIFFIETLQSVGRIDSLLPESDADVLRVRFEYTPPASIIEFLPISRLHCMHPIAKVRAYPMFVFQKLLLLSLGESHTVLMRAKFAVFPHPPKFTFMIEEFHQMTKVSLPSEVETGYSVLPGREGLFPTILIKHYDQYSGDLEMFVPERTFKERSKLYIFEIKNMI